MHDWKAVLHMWSKVVIVEAYGCALFSLVGLILGFTARIDQTVTVRGRLEPSGSVRDVESLVLELVGLCGRTDRLASLYLC